MVPGVLLKKGEVAHLVLENVGLVEPRRGPSTWVGGSQGVSFHVAKRVTYRVGATKGHLVQGDEAPTIIDTGTGVVTNQRIIFIGAKRTTEWAYVNLLGFSLEQTGTAIFNVSNRQKASGLSYPFYMDSIVDAAVSATIAAYAGPDEYAAVLHVFTQAVTEAEGAWDSFNRELNGAPPNTESTRAAEDQGAPNKLNDPADGSAVAPEVAEGIAIRWVDRNAPWLPSIGGDPRGPFLDPAIVVRVALRLRHDTGHEFSQVLFPLQPEVTMPMVVDIDPFQLLSDEPPGAVYRVSPAPIESKEFWIKVERTLIDLLLSAKFESHYNKQLDLYSRLSETPEDFTQRCAEAAGIQGDAEAAKLRDKYDAKLATLQSQLHAENKIQNLHEQIDDLKVGQTKEAADINAKWALVASQLETVPITLEKSDVKVTQLSLVWIPVA